MISEKSGRYAVTTFTDETLGLALSGGGFRASLFHIGVLARLAELDVLRSVAAISTVSGGSIIGAQFYLFLKKLLEEKPDASITREDYIELVRTMQERFLAGVQQNIRMRTFLDPIRNLRMFGKDYSRSDRLGELYDTHFYQGIIDQPGGGMIQMRHLRISPAGWSGQTPFHPMRDNGQRKAKIPVLLINATALNNGHSWIFEASSMGEQPQSNPHQLEVDKNFRLCRPDSYDNTKTQKDMELGLAVAASACVPGVFPPLAISGLYERGVRVELVDGGVYDNQGIQALLDRKCTTLIVSDASGQMDNETDPRPSVFAVAPRANSILMDRVRDGQLLSLLTDRPDRTTLLHLRREMDVETVPWIDANGQPACREQAAACGPGRTSYGVPCPVLSLLSSLRTDLDAFHDVEAYSLMLQAYRMTSASLSGPDSPPDNAGAWPFGSIAKEFDRPDGPRQEYMRLLEIGKSVFFKAFALDRRLYALALLAVAALIAALVAPLLLGFELRVQLSLMQVALSLAGIAAFFLPDIARLVRIADWMVKPALVFRRLVLHFAIAGFGAGAAWVQTKLLDPIYLKAGRYPQDFKK